MRLTSTSLAVLPISLWTLVAARLHDSLVPEDPYAFPKYRVTFLNGLPVLNETAQRWLQTGLHGGEAEFLEHAPPDGVSWAPPPPVKSIEGGSEQQQGQRSNVDNVGVASLYKESSRMLIVVLMSSQNNRRIRSSS